MTEKTTSPGFSDKLSTTLLKILPQHLLSDGMHWLARNEWKPLKSAIINFVVNKYDVDLSQAKQPDASAYASFNAFFTRELKPHLRPVDEAANSIVSPVDGQVSQIGDINGGELLQAKGHTYQLLDLLAGDNELTRQFEQGSFATIYLSPRDYHRIHMPVTGNLTAMHFVPGDLFSVSDATTQIVPNLFARNERTITLFDTEAGPMAVILVGAIFVGSMETVWHGEITSDSHEVERWDYQEAPLQINKGKEMGRFNMGSTVILLFPNSSVKWLASMRAGSKVKMGEKIGELL